MDLDLSILIVAYNSREYLERALRHIELSKDTLKKEIIVVDNGSEDDTFEFLRNYTPKITLIKLAKNRGFVVGNNIAYQYASGRVLLLLNSDAFLFENTLQSVVDYIDSCPECGVVGCLAENLEGEIVPSIRFFPTPWRIFLTKMGLADKFPLSQNINDMSLDHELVQECDWVTGCALFIRKEVVEELGFLLRPELYMYNDDNDLCLRVKKRGWKVFYHPARVIHIGGVSSKREENEKGVNLFKERLEVESGFVYFRTNYNLLYALMYFFALELFDLILIAKRVFLFKKNISIGERLHHMKFLYNCLAETKWGKSSTKALPE